MLWRKIVSNFSIYVRYIDIICLCFLADHSTEAEFIENTMQFVLKDVLCSNCMNVTDINVFRCKLTGEDQTKWTCGACDELYDMHYIQGKIIQFVKDLITLHQVFLQHFSYLSFFRYKICTVKSVCKWGKPGWNKSAIVRDSSSLNGILRISWSCFSQICFGRYGGFLKSFKWNYWWRFCRMWEVVSLYFDNGKLIQIK